MTTDSSTPEAAPAHNEALHGPRTYEVDALVFDQVTEELTDIAGCLEMLALITDTNRGPLQCDGEHHAALFRLLHRDTRRCASALEAM